MAATAVRRLASRPLEWPLKRARMVDDMDAMARIVDLATMRSGAPVMGNERG